MKLSELLHQIETQEMRNIKLEQEITNVAYHSKNVKPGALFVCMKGYKTDGHKYLQNAVDNGAIVAIVEDFQDQVDVPQIKVKNSRIALAAISGNYFDHPSQKMTVIGVTASNGKTTTAFMIDEILQAAGLKTGIIGTVMTRIGDNIIPSILTTPESHELQSHINNMIHQNITHLTMEVSSSGLELNRTYGIDFDYLCFNNISREHIDVHGSFEEYFSIKSSLLTNAKKEAKVVLNGDEDMITGLIPKIKASVYTYSVSKNDGDIVCKNLDLSTGRADWFVEINHPQKLASVLKEIPESFEVKLSVPGYHSVYNAMAAIGIALLAGIDVQSIQQGLLNFKGVERRFEFIYEDDFKVVDDHFANIGNINVTLETLDKMEYNNLHLVYAIRGNRGVIVNEENALTMVSWLKKLPVKTFVATKSVSHTTEKDAVSAEELEVFQSVMKNNDIEVEIYDELPEAIDVALGAVKEGDVILLAGCQGMDSGGKIILEKLSEGKSEEEKQKIMEHGKNRICGI